MRREGREKAAEDCRTPQRCAEFEDTVSSSVMGFSEGMFQMSETRYLVCCKQRESVVGGICDKGVPVLTTPIGSAHPLMRATIASRGSL